MLRATTEREREGQRSKENILDLLITQSTINNAASVVSCILFLKNIPTPATFFAKLWSKNYQLHLKLPILVISGMGEI